MRDKDQIYLNGAKMPPGYRYIPAGYVLHAADKQLGYAFYRATLDNHPCGIGFIGKGSRPTYYYRFITEGTREAHENRLIEHLKAIQKLKQAQKDLSKISRKL